MRTVNCQVCDKKFILATHREKNKTHTCSRRCGALISSKRQTKKIATACVVCNRIIKYKLSHYRKIKSHTCSRICSGKLKETRYLGEANPNNHYKLGVNLFKQIDTEFKAYLLGMIASDGHVGKNSIAISLHKKDVDILQKIKDQIDNSLIITLHKTRPMVTLTLNSKEMCDDVRFHLGIGLGRKAYKIQYPMLRTDLHNHFIRGFFDGDGSIQKERPRTTISSSAKHFLEDIEYFSSIKGYIGKCNNCYNLEWSNRKHIKVLDYIYNNATIYMDRKHLLYLKWKEWYSNKHGIKM